MTASYDPQYLGGCPYCSGPGQAVFHGAVCPRIKAIEYHPWGGIKRIEFHDGAGGMGGGSREGGTA